MVPGSIAGMGYTYDEAEMTGVSEASKNYLRGHAVSEVGATFRANDTATTGSTTVLNGQSLPSATGTGTLTVQLGQNGAAPTTGDPEWEGEAILLINTLALDSNGVIHQATWKPTGSTAHAWGTVA